MLDELYMQDLANAMRMPDEVVPAGTVTVSGPQVEAAPKQPEMGTITGIPQTAFEKALETSGVKLSELGDMIDQSAPGTLNTLLGREVPIIGNLKLRDFLPFVGSKDEGKLTGTPAALIAAGTGQPLRGQPVVGSAIGPDGQRYYGTSGSPAMLNEDVGTAMVDVATLGLGKPLAAGAKKAVKATKNMLAKEVIEDISGADIPIPKAPKIESKAFKNWFGESKVVDESSKPIVVYHARRGDFEAFDPLRSEGKSAGTGTFFSSSPDVAATYNTSSEHNLVPAYLSLKKPFIVDFGGANWNRAGSEAIVKLPDGSEDDLLSYFGAAMDETVSTDDVARLARKQGYDGVIIQNVVDHGPAGRFASKEAEKPTTIYVAFQPEQVKSVFNKGEFDPRNPNMLLGAGGAGVAATQEENK